ncbi:hypothetical protein PVAND_016392 [Polypedilum vanderplanki]|uniref:BZIP domain-containing protein n=1 Tax=Polypedilum vanderplanki TaxID=319348 RepID=A0A9J6BF11_POLVA|nr:hypothetical protein PVAND_016392 [Polypedilum vanderplanki]
MRNLRGSDQSKPVDNNSNMMKRPLTLDLNKKINTAGGSQLLLTTPDVEKMVIKSPELENFILNADTLQTPGQILPTPSTSAAFAPKITQEQEMYAKGFEEALNKIKTQQEGTVSVPVPQQSITKPTPSMSGGGINYSESDSSNLIIQQIKEEPQQPPSPQQEQSLNPIDMESQERIKLERKRQRNRVAASKCRKRKLERISKLEDRVKVLKVENHELGAVLVNLKQHVFDLKQQVIEHHQNYGCKITLKN